MRSVLPVVFAILLSACVSPPPLIPAPPFPDSLSARLEAQRSMSPCRLDRPEMASGQATDYFPRGPQVDGREGWAFLSVDVQPDGTVKNVLLVDEEPKGFGFGAAATSIATNLKYPQHPAGCQGLLIRLPFRFR